MGTIRIRFITVALVVSFFAIGMAAFLNYFKYKSTISNIVRSRVLLVGQGIENSVQASLQVGMQFAELSQLTQLVQREKSADRVIRGIDVFDPSGQILYSSERSRVGQRVPYAWVEASRHDNKQNEWWSEEGDEFIAGVAVRNSFNLALGHVGLRYSRDDVENATAAAGREILFAALAAFGAIALIAPLALVVVIRRFERDLQVLDEATQHLEAPGGIVPATAGSAFRPAVEGLRASLDEANKALEDVRARLDAAT